MSDESNRFYWDEALMGMHGQAALEEVLVRDCGKTPAQAREEAAEHMRLACRDPATGESTLTPEQAAKWRKRFDDAADRVERSLKEARKD